MKLAAHSPNLKTYINSSLMLVTKSVFMLIFVLRIYQTTFACKLAFCVILLYNLYQYRLLNIGFPGQFQQKSIHFNSWLNQFRFENECTLNQHSRVKRSYSISTVKHSLVNLHHSISSGRKTHSISLKPAARAGQPFIFINGQTFSKCLHSK